MSFLLDTCILSKLRKIKTYPNEQLESWFSKYPEIEYYISSLTIGEIQKGISKLNQHENKNKMILTEWLLGELIPRFEGRILPIDVQTAAIWGDLCGNAQSKGYLFPVIDSLLAATALQHHLILVTENTKDFERMNVKLFNPVLFNRAAN